MPDFWENTMATNSTVSKYADNSHSFYQYFSSLSPCGSKKWKKLGRETDICCGDMSDF